MCILIWLLYKRTAKIDSDWDFLVIIKVYLDRKKRRIVACDFRLTSVQCDIDILVQPMKFLKAINIGTYCISYTEIHEGIEI
jgi:hypothetical protein